MGSGSSLEAVDRITQSPGLHAEAVALIPSLEAVLRPAGIEAVRSTLGQMFAIFPQPDRSDGEWVAWWSAYIEDLSEFPLASLEAACREYRRGDVEFFPKPGILRKLAGIHRAPYVGALARARMASRQPLRPVVSKPDADARKAQVAEVMASIGKPKGGA